MNVAYLTYQFDNNPLGIPDGWVSQVIELGEDVTSPGADWVVTDIDTYNAYVASQQSSYNAWVAANPVPGPALTGELYQVDAYNSKNQLISSTFYTTKNSVGSYSGKARDIIYTIDTSSNTISSTLETKYDANGLAVKAKTETYYQSVSGNTQVIVEKS